MSLLNTFMSDSFLQRLAPADEPLPLLCGGHVAALCLSGSMRP
jgi:hypothetical protein